MIEKMKKAEIKNAVWTYIYNKSFWKKILTLELLNYALIQKK